MTFLELFCNYHFLQSWEALFLLHHSQQLETIEIIQGVFCINTIWFGETFGQEVLEVEKGSFFINILKLIEIIWNYKST